MMQIMTTQIILMSYVIGRKRFFVKANLLGATNVRQIYCFVGFVLLYEARWIQLTHFLVMNVKYVNFLLSS